MAHSYSYATTSNAAMRKKCRFMFRYLRVSVLEQAQGKQIAISPLVEMECLVIPLREHNAPLARRYEIFFEQYICLDMPSEVYRRAAELRARHSLKTPDALHLATAQFHGCKRYGQTIIV
jgi:predicted nucleic acid-binding protein